MVQEDRRRDNENVIPVRMVQCTQPETNGTWSLHLKGERRLFGWPFDWPDQADSGHFVIMEPEWVLDDNSRARLHKVERLIVPVKDVEMVECVKFDDEVKASPEELSSAEEMLVTLHKEQHGGEQQDREKIVYVRDDHVERYGTHGAPPTEQRGNAGMPPQNVVKPSPPPPPPPKGNRKHLMGSKAPQPPPNSGNNERVRCYNGPPPSGDPAWALGHAGGTGKAVPASSPTAEEEVRRISCRKFRGEHTRNSAGAVWGCLSPSPAVKDGLPRFAQTELPRPVVDVLLVDLAAADLEHGGDVAEVLFRAAFAVSTRACRGSRLPAPPCSRDGPARSVPGGDGRSDSAPTHPAAQIMKSILLPEAGWITLNWPPPATASRAACWLT